MSETNPTPTELLPCPFCEGGKLTPFSSNFLDRAVWAVFCESCQTEGPHHYTEAEAIAAWNLRPEPAVEMSLAIQLKEAAEAANAAWTPERSIQISCTPVCINVEGRFLVRERKEELRASRMVTWACAETMRENWLLELIEQVRADLARRAAREPTNGL